jgi:hypothetical protein
MIDHDLLLSHVPTQERLRHRVNLVVMSAVGEGDAFLDQGVSPESAPVSQLSLELLVRPRFEVLVPLPLW